MKPKKVFLLSGVPASGKSTFVKTNSKKGDVWVSRDAIRFSFLGDNEDYFSHEEEVFDCFINFINQVLDEPDTERIFIDATHLNKYSRRKTTNKINRKNILELNCVYFNVPFEVCKERNSLREGLTKVPETAMEHMYNGFTFPVKEEGFDKIYEVDLNGKAKMIYSKGGNN